MRTINNCTLQTHSTATLLRKRNSLLAFGIGIIAGYVVLILVFLWTLGNAQQDDLFLTIISLFFSIISIVLILGSEWTKLTQELNKRRDK